MMVKKVCEIVRQQKMSEGSEQRESLMCQMLELENECIQVLSRLDFKYRDLFEFKDYVQNDGTNDYYKHFLVYQYLKMMTQVFELRYIQALETENQQTEFTLQQSL